MATSQATRSTIGLVSTWPLYHGTTMDRHAHSLVRGICAAARDRRCRLLISAGVSANVGREKWRTAWPVPAPGADFVPVGPWNTDGLIVVSDDFSEAQAVYARDLQASGFPVVFTTPEGPGSRVVVDNEAGIRAAIGHLLEHGHRNIAFIAGTEHHGGDSAARLRTYFDALREAGIDVDPRLVAHGDHRSSGGRSAMEQILQSGAPFTALVASNDLSCLGALEALERAGRRVPDDVAAIGFDDILDARSHKPSLTTVRHPTFALGYQALVTLLDSLDMPYQESALVVVPTRLIKRQSCGCGRVQHGAVRIEPSGSGHLLADLPREMAEAALNEARHSTIDELEAQCRRLVTAFVSSIERMDGRPLSEEVARLLAETEAHEEDAHVWQSALSALYLRTDALLGHGPVDQRWFMGLLDQVRLEISEQVQRLTTRALLDHVDMMSQLGLLTAQLIATQDVAQTADILQAHLPQLGIEHFLVALYDKDDEDPVARSEVLLVGGLPDAASGLRFMTRQFPPVEAYPVDGPLQLLVLPLQVDAESTGFVALPTAALEPAAAIVSNLAVAIRAARLYREAVSGRLVAEDANRLKSRFLSMVSHELRTPLSIVVGLSDMVLRESRESEALPSNTLRDIERLSTSAQHLGQLVGDVLDLASSEAGQLRLVRQPLDLSEVLPEVGLVGEQMARQKGLAWRAAIPPSVPLVLGDRTRLRQVVLNLIANAVKFTEVGGVSLELVAGDGKVTVSISDSGPGIPEDERARVFDEFYRSDRITPGTGGLGLGLAIAKQLVEQHGGTITIESPGLNGRGSTFSVELPTLDFRIAESVLPRSMATVLVLTDRSSSDQRLADHLRQRGIDVLVQQVGPTEDPGRYVVESRPAAVVLEGDLATNQGWQLARLLRSQSGFEGLPIIAHRIDSEQGREGLFELSYLVKPIELAELAETLSSAIASVAAEAGATILVVDDDPEILELHSRVVEQAGYRAIQAGSGIEALAIIEQTPPALVLLDLVMPQLDGFAVLEAIRSRSATRDVPVVVVTGQTLTDADVDRLNRGVAAILSKGILTRSEIIARIEAALARRRALGSGPQQLVRRATIFIEEHHAEPITRDDIAQHVAMSPDYLTDCFHREMGITPIVYLNRCRIREAKKLLDTTDQSVTEIALRVGYSEVSHFTRVFHREVGVSPRAYRRDRHGRDQYEPAAAKTSAGRRSGSSSTSSRMHG